MKVSRVCGTAVLSAVAVAVFAGCGDEPAGVRPAVSLGSTPSATSAPNASTGPAFDVAAALRRQEAAKPVSAQMDVKVTMAGEQGPTMSGRMNLNGPLAGRMTLRMNVGGRTEKIEQVLTAEHAYVRLRPTDGWRRMPREAVGVSGSSVTSLAGYAELLAGRGPLAYKGMEVTGGVRAARLSGRITADEVRSIEKRVYDHMRAERTDAFACDVWVDESGRVIRLDQWLVMRGRRAHNSLTLRDFGPPITVKPPAGAH
jgi:hypothetical protein